jgi:hypothetical protein
LETLSEVGALKRPREIQGPYKFQHNIFSTDVSTVGECRGNAKVKGMLKTGTLQDMYEHASERVLNCLSLPTSNSEIISTPGLRLVMFSCIALLPLIATFQGTRVGSMGLAADPQHTRIAPSRISQRRHELVDCCNNQCNIPCSFRR